MGYGSYTVSPSIALSLLLGDFTLMSLPLWDIAGEFPTTLQSIPAPS